MDERLLPYDGICAQYPKGVVGGMGSGLRIGSLLARQRAVLLQMEKKNTLGHDVGFVSFPFVEELAM